MLHNLANTTAIQKVHLDMHKPLDHLELVEVEREDECPRPYLSKMFQFAGVRKDYEMRCLLCLF